MSVQFCFIVRDVQPGIGNFGRVGWQQLTAAAAGMAWSSGPCQGLSPGTWFSGPNFSHPFS